MLLKRSRLAATGLERPRLIQPWVLVALGAVMLAVLAAIFPYQALLERVLASQRGDSLTTSYLRNLLRTDPGNHELRLSLARQKAAAGQYALARRTLEPLLASGDAAIRREAVWTAWLMARRELAQLPPASPDYAVRKRVLLQDLQRIAGEDWDESTQASLAEQAMQLGDLPLALAVFRKLESRRGDLGADWYARVARLALGSGDYRLAARFQLVARSRAVTRIERREHFMAAVAALQAGDLAGEAVELADANIGELAEDQEVLYRVVQWARAANRLDLADKYMRLLLRLSLLRQMLPPEQVAHLDFRIVRSAAVARGPQLPFDDRIYTLGYDVFLANGKQEDAYQVAAAAVRQAPDHAGWRLRLARAAEWTQRPAEALTHWQWLARREGGDEAWAAVLRLAPGLFDDEALLEALQQRIGAGKLGVREAEEIVALYERLGDPRGGLRFLDRAYARRPDPRLLQAMAELAERAGEDEQAIAFWQRLVAGDGLDRQRALHLAGLLAIQGRLAEAYSLLDAFRPLAAETDAEFWRAYAEFAQLGQQEAAARMAYEKLVAGGAASQADYAALLDLLRQSNPDQAARLALRMAERYARLDYLVLALGIWVEQARWHEVRRLLDGLAADRLAAAEGDPEFLRLRARYHQAAARPRLAQRDLERALALAPADTALREAVLWQAIDGNDAPRLKALLARHEAQWRRDARLHDALAAAHQALSQPRLALDRYLTPRLPDKLGDFLWLMNYADALEQDARPDPAWRLRAALWREARQPGFVPQEGDLAEVRRVARARLAVSQRPGDARYALLRELLALDRAGGEGLSAPAKELVLAWLQDAGETTAERGFLWQQYGANLARPLWAEVAAALAVDARSDLAALLEKYGERLPRYDRVNAARRIGDLKLATTHAFESQEVEPEDDEVHLQLTETLLEAADRVAARLSGGYAGALDERPAAAELDVALAPDLRLAFVLSRVERGSRDPASIGAVPPTERLAQAQLAWRHDDGETRIAVGRRHGLAATTPLRIERQQNMDRRLGLGLSLGHHVPALDSAALRAAGMQDRLALEARYQVSRLDRVAAQWSRARLMGQTGTVFGSGDQWFLEYAHSLRSDLPGLEISAFASGSRYSRDEGSFDEALRPLLPPGGTDMAALFVPDGARLAGLRLSSNVRLRQDYTRALRPYFSLALTGSDTLGSGYDLLLGVAGSVFGADHFQAGWNLSKGGSAAFSHTRDFGFSYRLHF